MPTSELHEIVRVVEHKRADDIYYCIWKEKYTKNIVMSCKSSKFTFNESTPPELLQRFLTFRMKHFVDQDVKLDVITPFGMQIEQYDHSSPEHNDHLLLIMSILRYTTNISYF